MKLFTGFISFLAVLIAINCNGQDKTHCNIFGHVADSASSKEIHESKNWFRTRSKVKPCKSCIYNALCPPISNYEYYLKEYNLCNIINEK